MSYNEIPSGAIDGSNMIFTLANTPISGATISFNGQILTPKVGSSNKDYTLTTDTITLTTAYTPVGEDVLLATYSYWSRFIIYIFNETLHHRYIYNCMTQESTKGMIIMNEYKTSDLSLAAFLMMKGLVLLDANKNGPRFQFVFDDLDGKADVLSIEYINSDFSKFDNSVRTLKKLLYKN